MKKYLFFLPVAAVLSVSCSNEEPGMPPVNPDEYITFGAPAVSSAVTRAPLEAFPDGGKFQVIGYLKSYMFSEGQLMQNELDESSATDNWAVKGAVAPPSVFLSGVQIPGSEAVVANPNGVTVTYSNGSCTYDNLERWDENPNALYSFYYIYPDASVPANSRFRLVYDQMASKAVGLPNLVYTMPFSGGDASTSRAMDDVDDAMYGFSEDVRRGSSGIVTPQLKHLLAGLNVQINNYSASNDVVVTSVRVYSNNFRQDITLNNDFTTAMGSNTYGGSFQFITDGAVTVPKVDTAASGEMASGNSHKLGNTMLMVPYNSPTGRYFGDDAMVEITYTFGGSVNRSQSHELAFGLTIESGVIYTLQLNFVGSDLVLDFIVDNSQQWEDGNEGDSNGNITFE